MAASCHLMHGICSLHANQVKGRESLTAGLVALMGKMWELLRN